MSRRRPDTGGGRGAKSDAEDVDGCDVELGVNNWVEGLQLKIEGSAMIYSRRLWKKYDS